MGPPPPDQEVVLISTNSADLDEMQHCAAFYLGLHCFPKCPFGVFSIQRVKPDVFFFSNQMCVSLWAHSNERRLRKYFVRYVYIVRV